LRVRPSAGQLSSEFRSNQRFSAEEERLRRLFGVLEDVARYNTGNANGRMLAAVWDRIAELVQVSGDLGACKAAALVAGHEPGSSSWWLAIRAVATVFEDGHRRQSD
jgi:hypothetical protein